MCAGRGHYDILGIPRAATVQEVRSAYKRRALQVHPDRGGDADSMHEVHVAFETLPDPLLRAKYDMDLRSGSALREDGLQGVSAEASASAASAESAESLWKASCVVARLAMGIRFTYPGRKTRDTP